MKLNPTPPVRQKATKPSAGKAGWEKELTQIIETSLFPISRKVEVIMKLLASELARGRERMAEEIEGMKRFTFYADKGLSKPQAGYPCGHAQILEERSYGYNQALTEVARKVRGR